MKHIAREAFDVYEAEQSERAEAQREEMAANWDMDCFELDQMVKDWGLKPVLAQLKKIARAEGGRLAATYQEAAELNYVHITGYTDGDEIASYQENY